MLGMSETCYNHLHPQHPYMLAVVNLHDESAHNIPIVSNMARCTVFNWSLFVHLRIVSSLILYLNEETTPML